MRPHASHSTLASPHYWSLSIASRQNGTGAKWRHYRSILRTRGTKYQHHDRHLMIWTRSTTRLIDSLTPPSIRPSRGSRPADDQVRDQSIIELTWKHVIGNDDPLAPSVNELHTTPPAKGPGSSALKPPSYCTIAWRPFVHSSIIIDNERPSRLAASPTALFSENCLLLHNASATMYGWRSSNSASIVWE
ncbi:uncharacterized protein BO80DRAFT_149772 [Aspergillus ibericus CBS 121593]|uniref:Uncharacterized protein n=1 Tax=Aspergillus ibericus CBS 121593 TaxID=1448316 RepID=A0A395GV87_9EURO|nr:hypothetical protein BO80DRAFT_149772 [Aspergillus ibericus CBS 121593]RAK98928.1 hypothetical protein BO80DRAFT_149772 [Aspergillus ibericus CBS 121593]